MAVLNGTDLTLVDWAKRLDPDGRTADVAEILSQDNEALMDATWFEGNLPTGNKTTIRTGLPNGTVRKINQGVAKEKSQTDQIIDTIAMLETYSEVDTSLASLNGNTSMFLKSESDGFLEGLNQTQGFNMFYSDSDLAPEEYMGLGPRYSSTTAGNGRNVLTAGGAGADNTSIYLVGWNPDKVSMFFPKGSKAGLNMNFKGIDTVFDANGNQFEAYRTHYKWDAGMVVRDWRYVVRIANIDVSDLTGDKSGASADLTDLMAQALELIPNMGSTRPAFYMNRTVSSFLRRQVNNTNNVQLAREEVFGKMATVADGVPIRRMDALHNAEALVA